MPTAQWQSLWLFRGHLLWILFLFLIFELHELGGFLSSWVSLAFVGSSGAVWQFVFRRDVKSIVVAGLPF